MKHLFKYCFIFFCLMSCENIFAQGGSMIYSSFLKFPNSYFDVSLGYDHRFQLTKKKWSSGRVYLVASPYLLWKGYNFDKGQLSESPNLSSKYDNYQVVLPVLFRFEFAPNRILLGNKPGKHDRDAAIYFETGLAAHYSFSYHLKEVYEDSSTGYTFIYDNALTPSTPLTYTSLNLAFGFRLSHWNMLLRFYKNIKEAQFSDPTKDWPPPVNSFFFSEYSHGSFYEQYHDYVFLCIGYSF